MEGIARYIYETTKAMVLAHPEDEFHFFFDRAYDKKYVFADNVIPHVLFPQARHPLLWHLWFEYAVPRKLKKLDIDVFYSGDMYLSKSTMVPQLLVSHDLNFVHQPEYLQKKHRAYLKKNMPLFHSIADHIISVSDYTKSDIVNHYGIDPQRISVAGNATPEGFTPLDSERIKKIRDQYTDGKPYYIYVGSLHPRKNIARLLKAYDLYKQATGSDYKLVIYGRNAWETSDISEVLKSLNYKQDVIFLSNNEPQVSDIMGAAFALTYVSLFEGFGIPILEGFSAGVPVITSTRTSMPEVAGDAAILVDPESTQAIANAMVKLHSDEKLRFQLIEAGHLQKELFSWEKTAKTIYSQLKGIAR